MAFSSVFGMLAKQFNRYENLDETFWYKLEMRKPRTY